MELVMWEPLLDFARMASELSRMGASSFVLKV